MPQFDSLPTPRIEPPVCNWVFPDAHFVAHGEEIVGVGADLAPGTLLAGYRRGLFPMPVDGVLAWWSPDPRGVLPLDGFQESRSLLKSRRRFTVTFDLAFAEVVRGCADPRRSDGWITPDIAASYASLADLGWAHSIEVWSADGRLAGGVYGVEVGGLFAGESMFHIDRDASKVALLALVGRLRAAGGDRLFDVQWKTPHLASLGVVEMSRTAYLDRLETSLALAPVL